MTRRLALNGASALIPLAATIAALAAPGATAAVPACAVSSTAIWLGDGPGGGTAGSTYYPLEFSNVGHSSCTFYGYAGVSAWGLNGVQVGLAATRTPPAGSVVTLAPGATAHAILRITDWGAECAKGVSALGLKVYAPGQKQAQTISFPLTACKSRGILSVGPLRAGVGIPGYTTS